MKPTCKTLLCRKSDSDSLQAKAQLATNKLLNLTFINLVVRRPKNTQYTVALYDALAT
jgi:hypothetical protein